MKAESISIQKEVLALRKAKLANRERVLKEKERKLRTRKLIELGDLICKAGIDNLSSPALFGALLDIKQKAFDKETVANWEGKGTDAFNELQKTGMHQLIISFESDPAQEAKALLREMKFKWHSFRREWYGYGKRDDMQQVLKDHRAKIEIASNQA